MILETSDLATLVKMFKKRVKYKDGLPIKSKRKPKRAPPPQTLEPKKRYKFTLNYPPSKNQLQGFNKKTGAIYETEVSRQYKSYARSYLRALKIKPVTYSIEIIIIATMPGDKRWRDLQNCEEILLDSLQNFVYFNDRQIIKKTIVLLAKSDSGRVDIEIIEHDTPTFCL